MNKLLQFVFHKVYWFYEEKTSAWDPDVYTLSFLCLWIILILSTSFFLFLILFDLRFVIAWFEGKNKYLLTIPGIIVFIIAWWVLMSNDGYKEWIKPELFEDTTQAGKWSNVIFWGLFLLPFTILILAKVLY